MGSIPITRSTPSYRWPIPANLVSSLVSGSTLLEPRLGLFIERVTEATRAALDQHWAASDVNGFETEHSIYHKDAVLEYPQSGERIRDRCNI